MSLLKARKHGSLGSGGELLKTAPLKLGLDGRGMWLCQARGSKFQKGGRFTEVRSWDRGMNTDSVIVHISDFCSKGTAGMVGLWKVRQPC